VTRYLEDVGASAGAVHYAASRERTCRSIGCCACYCRRTPGDKFQKEYAYNIRYNYGQEGKRENWSEWSCVKIISQVKGAAAGPIA
jgi:DNA primase large subunit